MVQTRNQWNKWANRGFRNTQSQCSDCSSQSSNGNSQGGFDFYHSQSSQGSHHSNGDPNPDRDMYGPNDHCKRHRKDDGQPKTEAVTTYRRRKPSS